MLQISTDAIKELREKTGAGVIDCKKALDESCGDLEKACAVISKRGLAKALKKADRTANKGIIEAYVHQGGKIAAIVEINCETDFVARTDEFKNLAHDLAMQIAAMCPIFVCKEDMPASSDFDPQVACLLLQPFIKDPTKTIQDVVTETVAKIGENIKIRRFSRFELGC
jgi:elongation factor Ts